jgi:serine/threonine protein phosphatase PrpC
MAPTQQNISRFDLADIISAVLIPGTKRPLEGCYVDIRSADALLISPVLSILAVADGPERNPIAASSFLKKLDDTLTALPFQPSVGSIEETFSSLVRIVNDLIKTIDYHNSTTFSALMTIEQDGIPRGIILHTGDSLILRIEGNNGKAVQISRTSHVLVGRAPALFQTEIIALDTDDLIVLASDGITDLARTCGLVPAAFLSRAAAGKAPMAVVDEIVSAAGKTDVRLDDITIVCAAPGRWASLSRQEKHERVMIS